MTSQSLVSRVLAELVRVSRACAGALACCLGVLNCGGSIGEHSLPHHSYPASVGEGASFRAVSDEPALCRLAGVSRRSLELGERAAYTVPSALATGAAGILLAGHPTYLWSDPGQPDVEDRVEDGFFGAVVAASGQVTLIPNPSGDPVGFPKATERSDGSWHVVFFTLEQSFRTTVSPAVTGLWAGVLDGDGWHALREIEIPEGFSIRRPVRLSMVAHGVDSIRMALSVEPMGRVLFLEFDGLDWRVEPVEIPGATFPPQPFDVWGVEVLPSAGAPSILTYKGDPQVSTLYRSLITYARRSDGTWDQRVVFQDVGLNSFWDLSLTSGAQDFVVISSSQGIMGFAGDASEGELQFAFLESDDPSGSGRMAEPHAFPVHLPGKGHFLALQSRGATPGPIHIVRVTETGLQVLGELPREGAFQAVEGMTHRDDDTLFVVIATGYESPVRIVTDLHEVRIECG